MTDIVERLRSWVYAVHSVPVSDLLDESAAEIERLRNGAPGRCETVPLTDAEREAVERATDALSGVEDLSPDATKKDQQALAALRGLLERLK